MRSAGYWWSKVPRLLPRAATTTEVARNTQELARLLLSVLGRSTASGVSVTSDSAMRVGAVYACVRVLSDSVAMLPLQLHETGPDGRTKLAREHAVHKLLCVRPNRWQTAFEFWRLAMGHVALRGNFFARIVRRGPTIDALLPLNPDRMRVVQTAAGVEYHYTVDSRETVYKQADVLHLRGLSTDGLMGLSPIEAAAEAVGLAIRTEQHGAKLFTNGAQPAGVLTHPANLSEEAAKNLTKSFEAAYSGVENAHKTMVLEEGLTWQKLGLTAEESQFIDSRKFQRNEIAMFFGVPPHMIGDIERGTSWGSGIEQQGLGFVTYTLLPYLTNIAQAVARDLLTEAERDRFHAKFDTEALTRADFLTRQQGLQIMRSAGVINANEWRQREGMNPRTDDAGDDYIISSAQPAQPVQDAQKQNQLRAVPNAA